MKAHRLARPLGSTAVLSQKHATHRWVRFYYYEWVSLLFIYEDSLSWSC